VGVERVCVGVVAGAQGIRGAVRIKSFTAQPENVAAYGPVEDEAGTRRLELRVVGMAKGTVVAMVEGIADRNAAERLKGVKLFVPREKLPPPEEEEYYHADLIGLEVVLTDGVKFGTVHAIHDFGAGDSVEITRVEGGTIMVPFTRLVVPVVDLAGGRLVLDPPAGLLEAPEPESEPGPEAEG